MNIFAISYWYEKTGKPSFGFCKAVWDGTYLGLQRITAEIWKFLDCEQPPIIVGAIPVKDMDLGKPIEEPEQSLSPEQPELPLEEKKE